MSHTDKTAPAKIREARGEFPKWQDPYQGCSRSCAYCFPPVKDSRARRRTDPKLIELEIHEYTPSRGTVIRGLEDDTP